MPIIKYKRSEIMRDSLIILGSFLLGLGLVLTGLLPKSFYSLDYVNYSNWVLYAMMFLVGVNIGVGDNIKTLIKKLPKRVLLLPLVTFFGTILGTLVAYLIIRALGYHLTLLNAVTINTAMGYYSLSAILITQAWGATLGSTALLTNLMRELFTILMAKPISKLFGKYAVTSSGGITVTDTTLPIILKCDGNEIFPAVLYCGVVINLTVPFLLTLLLSL